MKRRDFVKLLPMGFGAATSIPLLAKNAHAVLENKLLTALANPQAATDKILVIMFLEGGNDGLNTLIPFTDPTYDRFRANTGFVTAEEKSRLTDKLSDTLAFNPYMSKFAELWKEGKVAAVQNVGLSNPNLSHFRATDIWNSACDHDQLLDTGWIGRWKELEYPDYPEMKPKDPIAIAMGTTGGLFQGKHSSVELLVSDPNHYEPIGIEAGLPLPTTKGGEELKFVRQLVGISDFYGQRLTELFPKYAKNMVEYPDSPIGMQLKQIAWCIASGLSTKVYFTRMGTFDTHFNQHSKDDVQYDGHGLLLRQFSEAVHAFQNDLKAFGLEDRVLTMTYSEFGRRAFENGGYSSGTDHGTAAPHFVIGSNVNGGLYGHNPDLETLDENGDPISEFEFRQMYASVMGDWFGVSQDTCTAVLSPGRDRAPFETEFELNNGQGKQKLIRGSSRVGSDRVTKRFRLNGNYPNPAVSFTRMKFQLERSENVRLELFDARGLLVTTMINTRLGAGEHTPELRTAELPVGSYVYRLTVGDQFETRQLKVVR
jgi:uncharacterized protein (DUF1501 family)